LLLAPFFLLHSTSQFEFYWSSPLCPLFCPTFLFMLLISPQQHVVSQTPSSVPLFFVGFNPATTVIPLQFLFLFRSPFIYFFFPFSPFPPFRLFDVLPFPTFWLFDSYFFSLFFSPSPNPFFSSFSSSILVSHTHFRSDHSPFFSTWKFQFDLFCFSLFRDLFLPTLVPVPLPCLSPPTTPGTIASSPASALLAIMHAPPLCSFN